MTNPVSGDPRILLLAYACKPNAGSEPTLGWNRALQAAKYYPTWVLCDEQSNRDEIEKHVAKYGPIPNLNFVFVPPSPFEFRLQRIRGMYYPAYNLWHRRAFKIANRLHAEKPFDLIHQLNLCGFREPGYLWKLDAPLVWGPIGGAQNYPWRFIPSAGLKGAISETFRNVINLLQLKASRRVGKAARRSVALLAANSTNARAIACRRDGPLKVMVETGVHLLPEPPPRNNRGPLRILWSGVFEHRKALHLLLHAVAALPTEVQYELRILGGGAMERPWRKLAKKLNIDQHCRWLGWLSHAEALQQNQWADGFAFTSLRDTTGNVVLEALAAGAPVLCLDHQGMADIVTEQCGVKLRVTTPREVIAGLTATLLRWHQNREELAQLSRGALERAEYYCWDRQGQRMAQVYRSVLKDKRGNSAPQQSNFVGQLADEFELHPSADLERAGSSS